jgi:hypothetical protein
MYSDILKGDVFGVMKFVNYCSVFIVIKMKLNALYIIVNIKPVCIYK